MESLPAARPPPLAGRDVASQRVRAAHQPVSEFALSHQFSPQRPLTHTARQSLVIFWATLVHCSKCET